MKKISTFFFFIFSLFYISHASEKNICPTSFCGSFSLDYPFKLQNSHPQNDCTYMNLTCNATLEIGTPILSLPYSGDFYVRYIGYYDNRYIQLYDPDDCLMKRLMTLNLSSSPFKAIYIENYTFYTCPSDAYPIGIFVWPIRCLSNSTKVTVMTSFLSQLSLWEYGCEPIGSRLIPVFEPHRFDYTGVRDDLFLGWDHTSCKACERNDGTGGSKDSLWAKFAKSPYFMPSFVALGTLGVICLLLITRLIAGRNSTNSDPTTADVPPESATGPPGSTAEGLDESKIMSCTELVVISENRRILGTDTANTCSICLENYHGKDIVRSIAKCEHCFHADCIELWLRKNGTCPVCRTRVVDVDEL